MSEQAGKEKLAGTEVPNGQDKTEPSVDELFARLGDVLKKMEGKDLSLEESFACYNKGMKLLEQCRSSLDLVEKKVLALDENGETHVFE